MRRRLQGCWVSSPFGPCFSDDHGPSPSVSLQPVSPRRLRLGESSEISVAYMEMEDRHNQPKITPERIKLQEITEKEEEEEDRISELPDCLLLEILSRLPSTKEAIKTGALSKRWEHLWTLVSTLIFTDNGFNVTSDFVSFVDKTLTQRYPLKLKKLKLFMTRCYGFITQVNNWIRYAIACNVEDLWLALWGNDSDEFHLDQSLFINTCLTHLTLSRYILKSRYLLKPTGSISWKNLKKLCISNGNLNQGLVENILSGSPVLETLVLDYCYVYYRLNITSKSVKNLELNRCLGCGRVDFDSVEIKAPNILSLTIKGQVFLSSFLLVNMSSLVEAKLDYKNPTPTEAEEEKLKQFIMNLRHVKELKAGVLCSKALSRLEAKGFVLPSNIKFPDAL